jgi:hypothetical protein
MNKEKATISQLYCEKLENELKEKQGSLDIIYKEIAKLYDYIDENRDLIEIEYVFEKLADIQNYCK